MILFANACVRKESRTRVLAEYLLSKLHDEIEEVKLEKISFSCVDESFLKQREVLIENSDLQNPVFDLARQFAQADTIVIAAPFWDLSFPALLKQYLEQVTVNGITFRYSEQGIPQGLCNANRLFYVTTAGGPIISAEYGYGYVKSLAETLYGITNTVMIKAENLDLIGADVETILTKSFQFIDELLPS